MQNFSETCTEHVIARDEAWVPAAERVKIRPTNVKLETTVQQKEETFQKVKDSESYEFKLANKRCVIDAEVLRKVLNICPRNEGEEFTEVQNDEDTLTFLLDLGYKGLLYKYTNMFVDYMYQLWRTLAACINKCLYGKTASNDKLKNSRFDILWGTFYRENVDYPDLIWEDIAYQIDHRKEKKSRRENMPYPRFTKVIIDYFPSKHKSLKKLKFQHYHTIKDDGTVSRLKYVRIREDYQEYGVSIPETMLNVDIIESKSYQRFLLYSTGLIPLKKSRGKGSQGKKTGDIAEENVDVSEESDPETLFRKKTFRRRVAKKKDTISTADNIVPDPDLALELGKSISLTKAEKEAAARKVHATHARIVSQKLKGVQTLTPEEQEAADIMKALKEKTESDSEDIYKYKIKVCKDADEEMKDADNVESENKEKEEMTDAAKVDAEKIVSSDYGDQFLDLSHSDNLSGVAKDSSKAEKLSKMQESKKSPEEIIKIKREQAEVQQTSKYSIKSTNKAALDEYDKKSALFWTMHENKTYNINVANYKLYHALMEAFVRNTIFNSIWNLTTK
nr:hypothetical protein [Tanacetum cinerariifolium]